MDHGKQIRVRFKNRRGEELAGILHQPDAETKGGIILSHCFTCSKDYKILAWLGRALTEYGFVVLRFDFAGLGESEGNFGATTLSDDIEDIATAVQWMRDQGHSVEILAGHSMGGTAAILAAGRIRQIRGIAVMGTSPAPTQITRIMTPDDWENLKANGTVKISVMGRDFEIGIDFISDLERHSPVEHLKRWPGAFLILHGTDDRIVDIAKAEELFQAARQPKSFFALAGGDHLLSQKHYSRIAAEVISIWCKANKEH